MRIGIDIDGVIGLSEYRGYGIEFEEYICKS